MTRPETVEVRSEALTEALLLIVELYRGARPPIPSSRTDLVNELFEAEGMPWRFGPGGLRLAPTDHTGELLTPEAAGEERFARAELVTVPRRSVFNAIIILGGVYADGHRRLDPDTAAILNPLCEADGMAWRFRPEGLGQ